MTYCNRPEQLRNTLQALRHSFQTGDQLIIVDDASAPDQSARQVLSGFDLPVVLVEITPEQKKWINPSIPYNMGFSKATADAVVIMNAECIPISGAVERLRAQVDDHNYVVMPCYTSTQVEFNHLCAVRNRSDVLFAYHKVVFPFKQDQWYHHPVHLPTWYHFTTCLTLKNLRTLGGFNEAFATGYCFEDNEFLWRVRKILAVQGWDENHGYVIHQWHPKDTRFRGGCPEWERNRQLWLRIKEGRE